ncbi:formylglycine-generating enzyme family protein [Duganella sp. LX47W]|uniref:Formylglycine-generating enzyme family protein n=1 Tax=Rugamonas apoptosis TaxID=2758570 RepID=A0A7W2FA23_9BURK|nr:formylglycine-generating enzyme family protein [Rugamonas apoptosis]MBA5687774.1 formylglycine-generating enzyme family protein [Rugamonas apoptosis]
MKLPLTSTLLLTLAAPLLASGGPAGAADYVAVPAGRLVTVLSGGNAGNPPVKVGRFAMRTEPVTNGEFQAFIAAHPEWQRGAAPPIFVDANYLRQYDGAEAGDGLNQQPVTNVSWFAAQAFCESEQARLPSWYEWEYVAAADERRPDARKDPAWRARILAWYSQASNGSHGAIGGKPNFYGIRDVHGLIWEWVDDFNALLVSADSRDQGDPEKLQYCGAGAISLQDRDNFAVLMRVALLSSLKGADSTNDLGFRCARSLTKDKK